jgi:hypothetical protein
MMHEREKSDSGGPFLRPDLPEPSDTARSRPQGWPCWATRRRAASLTAASTVLLGIPSGPRRS